LPYNPQISLVAAQPIKERISIEVFNKIQVKYIFMYKQV